jgi:hypothetical protein
MLHMVAQISVLTLCIDEYIFTFVKIRDILPLHPLAFAICGGTRLEELLQV